MMEKRYLWKGPHPGDHNIFQMPANCLRSTILTGTDASLYVNSVTWLRQRTTPKTCQKLLFGEYSGEQTRIGMDIWIIRSSNKWYKAQTGISRYRRQSDTTFKIQFRHVHLPLLKPLMLSMVFVHPRLYTRITILAGPLLWGWWSSVLQRSPRSCRITSTQIRWWRTVL